MNVRNPDFEQTTCIRFPYTTDSNPDATRLDCFQYKVKKYLYLKQSSLLQKIENLDFKWWFLTEIRRLKHPDFGVFRTSGISLNYVFSANLKPKCPNFALARNPNKSMYSKRPKLKRSDFGGRQKQNFFVFGVWTLFSVWNQNFFVQILDILLA